MYTKDTKGYSLVEVLVAVAILMISIVGPLTIAAKALQSAQYARQQNTAFFLAQEGITAVNTLRNNGGLDAYTDDNSVAWNWVNQAGIASCFEVTGCNIDFRDDTLLNNVVDCSDSATACTLLRNTDAPRAVYQHVSGEASPFTRVITLEYANEDEVLVRSRVSWGSDLLGGEQEVILSTSIFNIY